MQKQYMHAGQIRADVRYCKALVMLQIAPRRYGFSQQCVTNRIAILSMEAAWPVVDHS